MTDRTLNDDDEVEKYAQNDSLISKWLPSLISFHGLQHDDEVVLYRKIDWAVSSS